MKDRESGQWVWLGGETSGFRAPRSRSAEQSALLRGQLLGEGTTPGMGSGSGWGRFSVNLRFVEGKRLDLLMDFEIGHLGPIMQMFPPLPNCILPHPRSHPSLHSCSYLSHKHCPALGYSTECGAGPHGATTILGGKDLKQIPGGASLAVQSLRLHLPIQRVQVRSLVGELRSHMPCGHKTKKHKTEAIF